MNYSEGKAQSYEIIDTTFKVSLENQYGEKTIIDFNKENIYVVIFRTSRKIGTQGVYWTRAIEKTLKKDDVFYPIMENKKAFKWLPKSLKKSFIKNHLKEDLNNPEIKDKNPDEIHPTFLQDWENEVSKILEKSNDDVWVLKINRGRIVRKITGNYSQEKLEEFKKE